VQPSSDGDLADSVHWKVVSLILGAGVALAGFVHTSRQDMKYLLPLFFFKLITT
jgi:hypothetical protein